jgi:hypothetical protein
VYRSKVPKQADRMRAPKKDRARIGAGAAWKASG